MASSEQNVAGFDPFEARRVEPLPGADRLRREGGDLLDVEVHEQVIDPVQHAVVIEVVEDDTFGALAVQLQPDVVAGFEVGRHPCRRVDEGASLHRAGQRLLASETRSDEPRVVEVHLHVGVPPSSHDDLDPLVGEPLKRRAARGGRLEDVDAVECPTPVEDLGKRLPDVSTHIEHDPTRHHTDDARAGMALRRRGSTLSEMRAPASAGWRDEQPWSVTTVIPTFDAGSSLASTLDALAALDLPSDGTLEIVVSDDGSTDGTIDVASGYPNIRVVRGERTGAAGARNRGAGASSGAILAFVDSGDVPTEPWLRQIVATFQDPLVGMASWPAWVVDTAVGREQLVRTGAGPEGMVALATCFAVRRSIFDAVGGYDIHLRCGENSDLCERAASYCFSNGHRIVRADQVAARVVFGRPPAYYDRPRLDAAEYLLQRDADQLAVDRPRAVRLYAIAAVNAARCHEWSRACTHAWAALRRGRSLRELARAIVTLVPPLAEHLWSAEHRRARIGAA